ncbi:hypothetical protein [Ureibacillus sp. FSL K6-0786]|uniref:hypothetical protein n=1 Tax=Ureibacillus sp. FSL K6-0786 TaxID=2954607 RepID=UPI0030D9CC31
MSKLNKPFDLSKIIYEQCTEDPSIAEDLKEQISKQGKLQSARSVMSIPKGASMSGTEFLHILKHGYSDKE